MPRQKRKDDQEPRGFRVLNVIAGVFVGILLIILGVALGVGVDVLVRQDEAPNPAVSHVAPDVAPVTRVPVTPAQKGPAVWEDGSAEVGPAQVEDAVPVKTPEPSEQVPPSKGQPAYREFAVPVTVPAHWPRVTVVIDDMGVDRTHTRATEALPGPLTLSYLTYAPDLAYQAARGRTAGHELMAHMPMEPMARDQDPGPGALMAGQDGPQLRAAIAAYLDDWSGYVGVNNHMGSRVTADEAAMAVVVGELSRRGLFWLDSYTTGDSKGPEQARRLGVPWLGRDVFIDHEDSPDAIARQLAKIEDVARKKGRVIAIGHPRPHTIAALKAWLPTLKGKELALVPVSALLETGAEGSSR